jgi:putative Holliday junction resolvase
MRDLAGPAHRPYSSSFPVPIPMTDGAVLAFDFGTRRIGVAIGNGVTREARPLTTVEAAGSAGPWATLGKLICDWQPTQLVVGIPLYPDGTPHEMTARCERFARQLEGRFRLPVERVDERYSSAVAARADDVDAAAAALILQQWFDEFDERGRIA